MYERLDGESIEELAEKRLWGRLERKPSGCWIWPVAGYGRIRWGGRLVGAHRVAYGAASGTPVPDNNLVLHHCDEPRCCNPAHLYIGTHRDNMRDKIKRHGATTAIPKDLDQALDWISAKNDQISRAKKRIHELENWVKLNSNDMA